ncbi:MAG: hypothetical protein JJE45_03650 [Prolixibacteraceae bacterium]|nr:hypothetical protein [Prolixibacteraceae bacterium]
MNLFDLLANFWRLDEQKNFSGNETRLYFFLIHIANRSFWPEWIEFADKRMVANANISLQVLKSARERLQEAELLDFVPGGGFRVKTKYRILTPKSNLKHSPSLLNTKDKDSNINSYGKKKGFVHTGSDFD